jgi:uncharacterized phage protein gp47/JayE
MADDPNALPEGFLLPDAASVEQKGLRSWRLRHEQAAPGKPIKLTPRSFPAVAVRVVRDMLSPLYANSAAIVREVLIRGTFGRRLEARAIEMGLEGHKAASSSSGYIAVSIIQGGAQILDGTLLRHDPTQTAYQVVKKKVYQPGEFVPVISVDTGPSTNRAVGDILNFINPPAGVDARTTVAPQNDGTGVLVGLTGGRNAETDVELQDRMIEAQSNPPASGNSAEIIKEAQKTQGVPVEKAFFVPGFRGPGSGCVGFTVRPDGPTGSRIPSNVQRGQVEADVRAAFPTDNGYTVATIVGSPTVLAFRVFWRKAWLDNVPWPPWVDGPSVFPVDHTATVSTTVAPTSSSMRVITDATMPDPQPNQTIGLFDLPSLVWRRKRIKTVTPVGGLPPGTTGWDLTFEMGSNASELYIPTNAQLVVPWSDSLNLLPGNILAVMRRVGPGEQYATFPDPGGRQKRFPDSGTSWPSTLSGADFVTMIKATGAVSDVLPVFPEMPFKTPVGIPGVLMYLLEMSDLGVYPFA